MKLVLLLSILIFSLASFAQSSKVKVYLVKPDEVKKIRRDTLQTLSSLKLTDTTCRIVSFNFGFSVHGFTKDTVYFIKNEGALFNQKILAQTQGRMRPGAIIVIDEIIIINKEGKIEKGDMIFTNVY